MHGEGRDAWWGGGGACVGGETLCVVGRGACMTGKMATAADDTNPTGMHSCLSGEYFGYFQKLASRIEPMKNRSRSANGLWHRSKRTSCQLLNNFRVVLFAG